MWLDTTMALFECGAQVRPTAPKGPPVLPLLKALLSFCADALDVIGSTDAGSAVLSVAFDRKGRKVVSGLQSGTIKVWDSGAFWASNRPSLPKSDACWLVWQLRWISRLRNPTPTAAGSDRRRFPQTGRRSCQDRTIKRSKSGIRVRFGPEIAPPAPKLTPPAFPRSHAESQEREGQCAQRTHQFGRLFSRRQDHRVWIL